MFNESHPPQNPYARPLQGGEFPPTPPEQQASLGQRVAGILLLLSSLAVYVEAGLTLKNPDRLNVLILFPAIFDMAIGAHLARGSAKYANWAIARAAAGMTLGLVLRKAIGPFAVGGQFVFYAALLGLLLGRAEALRTASMASVATLSLAFVSVALVGRSVNRYPLGVPLSALTGEISGDAVETVKGRFEPYEITFPKTGWYSHKVSPGTPQNIELDRWLARPDMDAHVIVVTERLDKSYMAIDRYISAVLKNSDTLSKIQGAPVTTPWELHPMTGRRLSLIENHNGLEIAAEYAFVAVYERAYYIKAFAAKDTAEKLKSEFASIIASFRLPPEVQNAASPDFEPNKVSTVVGKTLAYKITAPNEFWRLRTDENVQKTNNVIDKWLSRPDVDSHVLIIAEELDQGMIEPDAYADAVIEGLKKEGVDLVVDNRVPWAKFPTEGRRLSISGTRKGTLIKYEYGMWAKQKRAYQVMAFTSAEYYPITKDEMANAINSFEPAP
ncbi:MAG: hypothetical protein IPK82_00460 [Polyangiaceae bacterium]|nr:hypothetical protein [Polyangiaceae bacterium]